MMPPKNATLFWHHAFGTELLWGQFRDWDVHVLKID